LCKSCKRVGGIWYESECMFRENLNGGMLSRMSSLSGRMIEILLDTRKSNSDVFPSF
jgi:hypothetical protein